jgi:hypothetical protein
MKEGKSTWQYTGIAEGSPRELPSRWAHASGASLAISENERPQEFITSPTYV